MLKNSPPHLHLTNRVDLGGGSWGGQGEVSGSCETTCFKGKEIKNTNILYNFAKRSVILSFIHHTLVLTAIIWLVLEVGGEDLGYLISTENGETVSSLKNFFVTALNNTKKHWEEMREWLSPPCNKNACKTLYEKI